MNKKILLPLSFIGFLVLAYFYKNQQTATISVTGSAKQEYPIGEVSLIVSKGNASSDITQAINQNESDIKQLIDVVKQAAGTDVEIKKNLFQVTPSGNQYVVANAFGATIKKQLRLSNLIRQLYLTGATSVSNIALVPQDKLTAEKELRQQAVSNAETNAKAIASSVGKSIKRVISLVDDQQSPNSTVSPDGSDQSLISVSKNVTVVYEIW